VTISCDYENAEPDSLEARLKQTQYQDEKREEIYDSLQTSLPDIHFLDTVTSLRLKTSDGRLHVHVTEDVNEIISYPLMTTLDHILNSSPTSLIEIRESQLEFGRHMSGFVYKVSYAGKDYIKKEIPGPDAVDEFLYEVNALNDLNASGYVIRLEAVVVDDSGRLVKGLLINFAQQGSLADLLFKHQGTIPWEDRMRWAQQAIRGLSDIHEAGYVQGDFTLSNLVVDFNGDAKIIDFNRRGCPVGWEPPEIAKIIASKQRLSMYIGEKSDIYQLGMTLWGLVMEDDSPEWQRELLSVESFPKEVPGWYRDQVRSCLALQPRDRPSATELVRRLDLLLSPARQTMILDQEPLACLSDHSTLDFTSPEAKTYEGTLVALPDTFAKDTSGNTTSLMPDCSKTRKLLPPLPIDLNLTRS
jgi:serine/threonine protein kinase